MDTENYFIDYDSFTEICYLLLDEIIEKGERYDGILCPLRGGFYLSDFMSRRLDLPISYIVISSYSGKDQQDFTIPYMAKLEGSRYLLCDDVYDSGKTIGKIISLYPGITFDTLCVASKVKDADVSYGSLVPGGIWIDFFWEVM